MQIQRCLSTKPVSLLILCLNLLLLELCHHCVHALLTLLTAAGEETASEKNTFVLRLKIMCTRQGAQMVNDRGQHPSKACSTLLCLCC